MRFREVKIKEVKEVKEPVVTRNEAKLSAEAAAIYAALFADDFVTTDEKFDPSKKIASDIILVK
jgi:hypothetical protein